MSGSEKTSAEVLFEFTVIGASVKVSAVDAATGTEVSIVGPAHAAPEVLEQVALEKLRRAMAKPGGPGDPGGPGIVC